MWVLLFFLIENGFNKIINVFVDLGDFENIDFILIVIKGVVLLVFKMIFSLDGWLEVIR